MKQVANFTICSFILGVLLILCSCDTNELNAKPDVNELIETENISLSYSIDKQTIATNEYIELNITAETSDLTTVLFPEYISAENLINIAHSVSQPKATGVNSIQYTCSYTFEATIPGSFEIPPVEITCAEFSIATHAVPITVQSLFAKGENVDIMDIEPELTQSKVPLIMGIILIIIAIVGCIAMSLRSPSRAAQRTPAKQAEFLLSKLQPTDADYAMQVLKICVKYLEYEVGTPLNTASTEEIIEVLSERRIFNIELIELTKTLFNDIDQAKFSQDAVSPERLCKQTLEFLARTSVSFEVSKEFAPEETL